MTTLDEHRTRELLAQAASTLEPPPGALGRVLDTARRESRAEHAAASRPTPKRRHQRWEFAAAAAVLVLVTAITTVLVVGTRAPTRPVALGTPVLEPSSAGLPAAAYLETAAKPSLAYAADSKLAQRTSGAGPTGAAGAVSTKIVDTGTVSLRVASARVRAVVSSLTALVDREGGYVANTSASGSSTSAKATIVLRVPQARFGALVAAVEREGSVASLATNADDVTSQYVDYDARIAAARASERQYVAIMAKATTIPSILAIQAQLNQIESEIEQLEGARNLLANEAAYGTLDVGLNEVAPPVHPGNGLHNAVRTSISGFVGAVEGLISGIGPAIFALLCLAALLLVGRISWRAARRRML